MYIKIEQQDVDIDKDSLKKVLINNYFQCQTDLDNRNDYLVEIYKAARFFYLSAFVVLVMVFSVNFVLTSPEEQAKKQAKAACGLSCGPTATLYKV